MKRSLVVRINRLGKNIAPRFANRYYDAVTVGIDFTARDLQRKFREQGNPWETFAKVLIRRLLLELLFRWSTIRIFRILTFIC